MEIIYCSGGNKRLAEIALNAGFLLGAQLPDTIYFPIYFADQNWRKPNYQKYLEYLHVYKPKIATVLDWEYFEQLDEIILWAEEISKIVETILIIPKISNAIKYLPKEINKKSVRLAFSYPTNFGAASWSLLEEMSDWSNGIHILGGQPHDQMFLAKGYVRKRYQRIPEKLGYSLNIKSVDGNYFQKKAMQFCEYWDNGKWVADNFENSIDVPYKVFQKSCENIIRAWGQI